MKRGAQIAVNVVTLGLFGFIRKIVENRKAVRAGKQRPHTPGELVMEALELGAGASLPAIKNEKLRKGITHGLEIIDEATPGERPSNKHKGVR